MNNKDKIVNILQDRQLTIENIVKEVNSAYLFDEPITKEQVESGLKDLVDSGVIVTSHIKLFDGGSTNPKNRFLLAWDSWGERNGYKPLRKQGIYRITEKLYPFDDISYDDLDALIDILLQENLIGIKSAPYEGMDLAGDYHTRFRDEYSLKCIYSYEDDEFDEMLINNATFQKGLGSIGCE